jgi:hypothetical protein
MPSDQHNNFTFIYQMKFVNLWANNKWGCCSATHKVHLPNGRLRDPDLSYWGYPQCTRDADGFCWCKLNVAPSLTLSFSLTGGTNEEDAINDMMNRALEKANGALSTTRPALGYLIRVKRTLQRGADKKTQDMQGLDIYRLPHGTTIADACDPNNPQNASHYHYVPTGPEYRITITPGDLGITGFWALVCG